MFNYEAKDVICIYQVDTESWRHAYNSLSDDHRLRTSEPESARTIFEGTKITP